MGGGWGGVEILGIRCEVLLLRLSGFRLCVRGLGFTWVKGHVRYISARGMSETCMGLRLQGVAMRV